MSSVDNLLFVWDISNSRYSLDCDLQWQTLHYYTHACTWNVWQWPQQVTKHWTQYSNVSFASSKENATASKTTVTLLKELMFIINYLRMYIDLHVCCTYVALAALRVQKAPTRHIRISYMIEADPTISWKGSGYLLVILGKEFPCIQSHIHVRTYTFLTCWIHTLTSHFVT